MAVALEEYRALRAEIVDAIQAQRTIMQVGTTGAAVLIGFGLQRIDALPAVLILMWLVPVLAIFTTVGALGELYRATRASCFLALRAQMINAACPWQAPAMAWEQWLRQQPIFSLRDRAEFFTLFTISTGAMGLGLYVMTTAHPKIAPGGALVAIGLGAGALGVTHIILHTYLIARARRQFQCAGLRTDT